LLPTYEGGMGNGNPRWNEIKAMAQHAEAAGFDSLWVNDHMVQPFTPHDGPPLGGLECWSMLASLAAVTSRVELGTPVACTSFRNPALLARMADTVEEVSGGRLILGLGAGYHEPEYRMFGFPFDHLLGRFEESLQIIHELLHNGAIDFQGQYYQARDCELRRCGPRPKGPPIMIGARPNWPRSLRLAAQYADYWNIFGLDSIAGLVPMRDAVDAACSRVGRDPATLGRTVALLIDLPGADTCPIAEGLRQFRLTRAIPAGTAEQMADLLRGLAREGVGHVQLCIEPNSIAGIDTLRPVLELLDREAA
jgi:alkanesulfonate monooxygenase SsuD/methylene tetrahydromethanopterin reductase-like flavin-dependent oxidoreductase (luciferase family)